MGHVVFAVGEHSVHARDLIAMNIYLMLRKYFKGRDSNEKWKFTWEQWRSDVEAAGYMGLNDGLDDPQFRQNFIEALDKTIEFVTSFGGEMDPKTLNELDDIWEFKYTKNFDTYPISKCLGETKEAVNDCYKVD